MTNLLVNEIFGPTIQGEGPFAGRLCAFCRLAICPLRCRWCDTWYTWAFTPSLALKHQLHQVADREQEIHEMTVEDTVQHCMHSLNGASILVLSGGEPLAQTPPNLQKPNTYSFNNGDDPVGRLVYEMTIRGVETHIETAGVRRPSEFLDRFVSRYVVSPKLLSSGNTSEARRVPEVLEFFADNIKASFKFVITEPEDFSEVGFLANTYKIHPQRIWVMPEGTTSEAIQRKMLMVAEGAIKRGYNLSDRMHVRAWGDKRGH